MVLGIILTKTIRIIKLFSNWYTGYLIIGICFQSFIWGGITGKISGKVVDKETGKS